MMRRVGECDEGASDGIGIDLPSRCIEVQTKRSTSRCTSKMARVRVAVL